MTLHDGFYAEIQHEGLHIRLEAVVKEKGWESSVLDLNEERKYGFEEEKWANNVEEAKANAEKYVRLALNFQGPIVWHALQTVNIA